jgi:hypothetical protein
MSYADFPKTAAAPCDMNCNMETPDEGEHEARERFEADPQSCVFVALSGSGPEFLAMRLATYGPVKALKYEQ